ncbi:MAG: hypothetical protein HY423_00145 [Candidatus Lambdaproteobacteria bacterium]|nr:hypothetical protein [Candidatus Lambdaproteobacteria bacterium]
MKRRSTARPGARLRRRLATLGLVALLALLGGAFAVAKPAWSKSLERSNKGEVEFVLTPRDAAGGRFRVDIVVTTHSGDLASLDLRTATELRTDGKTLRPVEAPGLSGHHTRGRLEFALERVPERFEIVIRNVRAMGDVTFRWP